MKEMESDFGLKKMSEVARNGKEEGLSWWKEQHEPRGKDEKQEFLWREISKLESGIWSEMKLDSSQIMEGCIYLGKEPLPSSGGRGGSPIEGVSMEASLGSICRRNWLHGGHEIKIKEVAGEFVWRL